MDFAPSTSLSIPLTPAQSHSKDEWEQKRPLITQLYRDEGKTLENVRSVLGQQSFRPTAAMLKKRIKKWDLDRNHKQADMLYAVKIALERESQGKKSAFLIRGRVVTFDEVQHYFRRKGVRDLRSLVKDADVARPTTRIEWHTPEPANIPVQSGDRPVSSIVATQSFENDLCRSSSGITVIPDPNQVGGVLRQSLELSQLDQLLHCGRDYYNSCFEGRDWKIQQEIFEITSLESFYHNLSDGHNLVNAGQVNVAFEHFDRAFGLIKGLLEKGTLLFLPYLYHILLPWQQIQQQDVLLNMLEFISQMIRTRFPHLRPVQQSLALLHGMSVEQRYNCSTRVFQSLLNRLQGVFLDDVPDESQLGEASKVLCPSGPLNSCLGPPSPDNYRKMALAVWQLYRDAERPPYRRTHSCGTRGIWAHRVVQEAMNYQTLEESEEWWAFTTSGQNDPLRSAVVNIDVHGPGYILGPINSRPLTTAALQQLDAELLKEDLPPKKSPRPRQHDALRPQKRRLGRGQGRIQQPSARSSF